ncbi:MAG: DNA alkylation repair protein [Chloroflexi bacterium]|nr:MAG: DNA alkylation repair protein [Chloroflexota bacterium]
MRADRGAARAYAPHRDQVLGLIGGGARPRRLDGVPARSRPRSRRAQHPRRHRVGACRGPRSAPCDQGRRGRLRKVLDVGAGRRRRRGDAGALPSGSVIERLRAELAAAADPLKAAGMQAYMKSATPYRGVNLPQVRAISRGVFDAMPATCDEWRETVLELWRGARYREERYAALMLARSKRHRDCLTPDSMPMLEEMVVTGAWWDYVDEIAGLAGDLLRKHPKQIRPRMRAWSTDVNMWKRRVSIICQLSFKRETDLELLYANIEPNLSDREFFIRKAIGWALRQYAWTDPKEVARYVRAHDSRLSGLSRREALKNILPRSRGKVTRRAAPGRKGGPASLDANH